MHHLTYLSDDKPICQDRDRLGNDFIQMYSATIPGCDECSRCSMEYNKSQYEEEMSMLGLSILSSDTDGLNAFSGLLLGIGLSSVFWVVAFIILERVFA